MSVPATGGPPRVCPWGQALAEQATTLHRGRPPSPRTPTTGAGYFVVAHSNGGKPALVAAPGPGGDAFMGFDISGHGRRFAVGLPQLPGVHGRADEATADLTIRLWAAPRTYHLSTLAFLEECLLTRDAAVQASDARSGTPVTELACQSAVR
ncbi:hypothetical protein E5082_18175 [Streptomyces griseoluteus]|uniref:Uncharacterized protein n=1 Tax=Streptomyces griseoluteus TaxID=29306 RepID=A0A4Z1DFZ5_STRGP|nr:hypothetical protein [Streptomyces griseoluteus]TGN82353.1 hypothetical protein E5082_18175 [Streptomyces griseoluteus]GHF10131.1 hypothetical protein GCM10017776_29810 [Streptomyces griseoluteus]